jgi:hypothetical protein
MSSAVESPPGGSSILARDPRNPAGACRLIPQPGNGLEIIGECQAYAGDALYDYIDGGAPQYFEYGFIEAASQEIRLQGRTYILDVYRMKDPLAAFGIFSTRRPDGPAPIAGFPRSCYAGYQGLVARGDRFLEIQASELSDSTGSDMQELASRALGARESEAGSGEAEIEAVLAALPAPGRRPGSERMARGSISLGAALGLSASGGFLRAVESVERVLAGSPASAAAVAASGAPVASAARALSGGPTWLIAGYHAGATGSAPLTTAVLLQHGPRAESLLVAIARDGHVPPDARPLEPSAGWIVSEPRGACWLAASRKDGLLLAVSSLAADSLESWFRAVAAR